MKLKKTNSYGRARNPFMWSLFLMISIILGCASSRPPLSSDKHWNEVKARGIITDICKRWDIHNKQGNYSIEKSLPFLKNGIRKRFVQISSNGESCHFCPGLIGAVIFSKNNDRWEVEFEDKDFAKFGFYGVPPKAKLIKIGSDRYGLLFQFWRILQEYCREAEEEQEEGYLICSGGYVHYVAIIDLRAKGYPLILEEKVYQREEDFANQAPVVPKVDVVSTANGDIYNIRIQSKIYKFREEKYKMLSQ